MSFGIKLFLWWVVKWWSCAIILIETHYCWLCKLEMTIKVPLGNKQKAVCVWCSFIYNYVSARMARTSIFTSILGQPPFCTSWHYISTLHFVLTRRSFQSALCSCLVIQPLFCLPAVTLPVSDADSCMLYGMPAWFDPTYFSVVVLACPVVLFLLKLVLLDWLWLGFLSALHCPICLGFGLLDDLWLWYLPVLNNTICLCLVYWAVCDTDLCLFKLLPALFTTEHLKVAYVITLLSVKAKMWATAEWKCQSLLYASYDCRRSYIQPSPSSKATHTLFETSPGSQSVSEFAVDFWLTSSIDRQLHKWRTERMPQHYRVSQSLVCPFAL